MKILFITHYYEPDSGAAANRLTRLTKQLNSRGHEITVLTTMPHYPTGTIPDNYRGRFVVSEDQDGIHIIQVWLYTSSNQKVSRRLLSQLSFMITCTLRGLFVQRHDVIFVENQPIFTGLAGWLISKLKRTPYIANISDYWPEYLVVAGITKETSLTYRVFKAIANRTQRDAKAIVTMLDDLLVKVENRIGKIDVSKVIYNAVDLKTIHPEVDAQSFREKHNLGDVRLITFLGVLGNHIDLETMLQATAHFNTYPNLKFLFIGTGQQKEVLKSGLQEPQFSHCQWIEWIDYNELPAFWSASYLTFWALHDNPLDQMRFQAKLYEAMASGTPAVIAVKGLMHDTLTATNTGLTVSPGDADGMIKAIDRLLNNKPYHRTISTNARQFAEENYDLQRNIDDYESILQKITQ
jgi:colanic acid biosynthesis glycosyl transferase WcaI